MTPSARSAVPSFARQSPSEPFEHQLGRHFLVAALLFVLFVAAVAVWVTAASINGAVVAVGTLVVEGKRRTVQHLDGGRIAAIHVKDGALVEKDALLVTLDVREIDEEREALTREIAARSQQVELIESELKGLLELQAKQLVPRSRVSTLQREAAGLAAEIARLDSTKIKLDGRRGRITVTAPVAGYVHNLSTHTIGGVIAPGAAIAEIVPTSDALVVEARIQPGDIDQVHAEQRASVRLTSLNQRTTPAVDGVVSVVSADLLKDEKGVTYYVARIAFDASARAKLGKVALVAGMPADVLIETGQRSVLSYLVKPLRDQMARALRED
jgi:multidrug efflux pump subunit AcrA (membrane-fusion protein)